MLIQARTREQAFTLVELLVVVGVISILAAIVSAMNTTRVKEAANSTVRSSVSLIGSDFRLAGSMGGYPTSLPAKYNAAREDVILTLVHRSSTYFCIQGTHRKYGDLRWYVDTVTKDATIGNCPASPPL